MCIRFSFQTEDGPRYLVRSRELGDVYKRPTRRRGIIFYDEPSLQCRLSALIKPWSGNPTHGKIDKTAASVETTLLQESGAP